MRSSALVPQSPLPLLVEPASHEEASPAGLVAWIASERERLAAELLGHAGVLFRGFGFAGPASFQELCRAVDPGLLAYVGGESPRTAVTDRVYTSTEYPSHLEISLHNEMSYARDWPRHLFFFCEEPADEGGETQLADGRRILAALDRAVRERFAERGVRYLRNLGDGRGLGKSWQDTFETSDPAAVEAHCRQADIAFEWTDFGLRTSATRPAVVAHPETGERVWFSQVDQWHVSSRGERAERALRRAMAEDELPRHACYGDGSPIPSEDVEAVRRACREAEVVWRWERGDVLVLDNVLAAHGRKPFTGSRRILVAMA